MQGHHSAKPHMSCQVPRCHVHACCSCSCELVDAHALSTHRSTVLDRRQFSLPAYTRVTNFCHIFGRGNGGRLIRGTAYTRVYTVLREWQFAMCAHLTLIPHQTVCVCVSVTYVGSPASRLSPTPSVDPLVLYYWLALSKSSHAI